jgi:Rps23 Pro-64 3,4-dihydroxylase Tpa1-like proline 4-hydroxylase
VSSRTPYHARKQINFHAGASFDAPSEQRVFWDQITQCFMGDTWFPDLVKRKYPEYFQLRFGELVNDPDFSSLFRMELFLHRYEPGYYIGPHTDIATRVFTCIFSFAERPGFEAFGTELVRPRNRLERCWGSDHYKPDGFEVVKIAPYAPNNFLLFFKTRHSFHSVRAIDDTVPNQRYGMQFQFYEPAGGLFKDLSVPDLMHVKHRAASRSSLIERGLRKLRVAS